ncbi:MAG TPA: hypothetical protein P5081_16725 [Phycisphaerae bacterium]|nr:hypothetical protein [Phycisphaerae bacterium]HRW54516.1 hypothetical protein [Phycisphaerae bacterium]
MGMGRVRKSGRLWLDGDVIRYETPVGDWRIPLDAVRIIGELTSPHGPFADDYFFCFAEAAGGWYEASCYAEGRDAFLHALGERLGARLEPGLSGSTDFASRILWPEPLAGRPMFDFTDEVPRGAWRRLRSFFLRRNHQTLSNAALQAIARGDDAGAPTEDGGGR